MENDGEKRVRGYGLVLAEPCAYIPSDISMGMSGKKETTAKPKTTG